MVKNCINLLIGIVLVLASFQVVELMADEYVPTFFDMDKDGDGVISQEEAGYWSALSRIWSSADTNQDGVIDMHEWNALDTKALTAEGKR